MAEVDRRATIKAKPNEAAWDELFGKKGDTNNVMKVLRKDKRGIIFPYTPEITAAPSAAWSQNQFPHSNYPTSSWESSQPGNITITADFTATNNEDAELLLATIHFFRAATKGGYGKNDPRRGTPPAVYNFSYLGPHQYSNVPVVILTANMMFPKDVDYVPVTIPKAGNANGLTSWVPTQMSMTIDLQPQYNVQKTVDEFSIEKFRSGAMLGSGQGNGGYL